MLPSLLQAACARASFCNLLEFKARTLSLLYPMHSTLFIGTLLRTRLFLPLSRPWFSLPSLPAWTCSASAFMFPKIIELHYLYILWFKLLTHSFSLSTQVSINLTYWGFTVPSYTSKIIGTFWTWANLLFVVEKLTYFLITVLFILLSSALICKFKLTPLSLLQTWMP